MEGATVIFIGNSGRTGALSASRRITRLTQVGGEKLAGTINISGLRVLQTICRTCLFICRRSKAAQFKSGGNASPAPKKSNPKDPSMEPSSPALSQLAQSSARLSENIGSAAKLA